MEGHTDPPGRPKCHIGAAALTTSAGSSQNILPGKRVLADTKGKSAAVKAETQKATDFMLFLT